MTNDRLKHIFFVVVNTLCVVMLGVSIIFATRIISGGVDNRDDLIRLGMFVFSIGGILWGLGHQIADRIKP